MTLTPITLPQLRRVRPRPREERKLCKQLCRLQPTGAPPSLWLLGACDRAGVGVICTSPLPLRPLPPHRLPSASLRTIEAATARLAACAPARTWGAAHLSPTAQGCAQALFLSSTDLTSTSGRQLDQPRAASWACDWCAIDERCTSIAHSSSVYSPSLEPYLTCRPVSTNTLTVQHPQWSTRRLPARPAASSPAPLRRRACPALTTTTRPPAGARPAHRARTTTRRSRRSRCPSATSGGRRSSSASRTSLRRSRATATPTPARSSTRCRATCSSSPAPTCTPTARSTTAPTTWPWR
jgi:hypothetical protein